ncbi:hypothetical protein TrVE_jg8663 [Triparma verrucosa]|uniref:Thiamin pyrophosphokinase thiamin-binding domain-containing protein n=1 Tax=Triparma verrucosa TaxID=1606542 RepID=A0A9W7EJR3_9STRA|nr:hypothetical protein TrVE_jg8663 [Triparma verrucosa]
MLSLLYEISSFVMCADGGANRLYDMSGGGALKPDAIKGDLDSIRGDVLKYYEESGVEIVKDSSQDMNDLEKCLWHMKQVEESSKKPRFDTVCVYGGLGGRFDQSMSSVSALFKFLDVFDNVVLVDEETTATLLRPCRVPPGDLEKEDGDGGEKCDVHVIRPSAEIEGKLCGLIPIFGTCTNVKTCGLKWDLNGEELSFGKLISSSNECTGTEVRVSSDNFLVWTTHVSWQ